MATAQEGATALLMAAAQGNMDVIRMLLAHGANVEATDSVSTHASLQSKAPSIMPP